MSMDTPLVSVCLPSLNTFPFLQERINTILGQTYTNWELIVIDSHSTDGSWELFQKLARQDQRVSITQAPRGLYESWNNSIQRARGQYVYIATSDDTMAPDCLEKLVASLEQHEDCDLAHCNLVVIDEKGTPVLDYQWPTSTVFAHGTPELPYLPHIRRAPYDGLLHLTGRMVYQSITELLIRRSLFPRIGGFKGDWGSVGDLFWDMKAGLVANTVHVPDTWASWRRHSNQITVSATLLSTEHARKVGEMICEALIACQSYLAPQVLAGVKEHWLTWSSDMRNYYRGLRIRPNVLQRRLFQVWQASKRAVRSEWIQQFSGRPKWPDRAPADIRNWLESIGLGPVVLPL